jgi:hypothetical protein
MIRRGLSVIGLIALAACGTVDAPTLATPAVPPSRQIYHWSSGGNEEFWFYDGGAPAGSTPAPFDPNVSPTVRICRVTSGACGPTLASFTRTSGSYGRLVTVDTQNQEYDLSWPTGSTGASAGRVYRVSVHAGMRELGFLDVYMVTTWQELFTTDQTQYVPWVAGYTLPVSFHIGQGMPGSIALSASSISVNVGDGRPITATLLGLHGQPLSQPVYWEMEPTSSPDAAVLDSGLVVGTAPGSATLWAWHADIVVQIPVTVTDTRRAWSTQPTPDDQGNRGIWGSSAASVYAANHTGLLRYDGAAWSHVPAVRWRTLHDVWGSSATGVWAVGDKGEMVRWDGTAWTLHRYDGTSVAAKSLGDFDTPASAYTLRGVWGSSAANVFAVGDSGVVLRYNGATWTRMATGTTAQLNDVWGSGPNDVYAATSTGRLLRFNGTAWSAVAAVQAPGALRSVWGSSAGNVYAVGDGGMMYRYNGSSWQRIRLPTRSVLYTVWGTGASNVYAAGAGGALYRYNGAAWTPEKAAGGMSQVHGIWGTSSGTDLFAAGAGGLITKR